MQEEGHLIWQEAPVELEIESLESLGVLEGEKQTDTAIMAEARRLAEEIQTQGNEVVVNMLNEVMGGVLSIQERAFYAALFHEISDELGRVAQALQEEMYRINDDAFLGNNERLHLFSDLISRERGLGSAITLLAKEVSMKLKGALIWNYQL